MLASILSSLTAKPLCSKSHFWGFSHQPLILKIALHYLIPYFLLTQMSRQTVQSNSNWREFAYIYTLTWSAWWMWAPLLYCQTLKSYGKVCLTYSAIDSIHVNLCFLGPLVPKVGVIQRDVCSVPWSYKTGLWAQQKVMLNNVSKMALAVEKSRYGHKN